MLRHTLLLLFSFAGCVASPADEELQGMRIALRHAAAAELAVIIDEVVTPRACARNADGAWPAGDLGWRCIADIGTNSLILRGSPTELREMAELVAQLDVPDTQPPGSEQPRAPTDDEFERVEQRVQLRHLKAQALVDELRRDLTMRLLYRDAEGRRLPCERVSWFEGEADATTNTIVVRGVRCMVHDVLLVIACRDVPDAWATPPAQAVENERRIVLRHARVDDVLPILDGVFSPGCYWPGPDGLYLPPEPTWHGEADPVANLLILRGRSEVLQQIADAVVRPDVPVAPVR